MAPFRLLQRVIRGEADRWVPLMPALYISATHAFVLIQPSFTWKVEGGARNEVTCERGL